jgi:hypothetical protein
MFNLNRKLIYSANIGQFPILDGLFGGRRLAYFSGWPLGLLSAFFGLQFLGVL